VNEIQGDMLTKMTFTLGISRASDGRCTLLVFTAQGAGVAGAVGDPPGSLAGPRTVVELLAAVAPAIAARFNDAAGDGLQ
jgi:hypothetical protein